METIEDKKFIGHQINLSEIKLMYRRPNKSIETKLIYQRPDHFFWDQIYLSETRLFYLRPEYYIWDQIIVSETRLLYLRPDYCIWKVKKMLKTGKRKFKWPYLCKNCNVVFTTVPLNPLSKCFKVSSLKKIRLLPSIVWVLLRFKKKVKKEVGKM